jgi:hypothetical protein
MKPRKQNPDSLLFSPSHVEPGSKSRIPEESEQIPGHLSVVPLLLAEGQIPAEVQQVLREGHLRDAAEMLIQRYGLSCDEASDLLDVFACE